MWMEFCKFHWITLRQWPKLVKYLLTFLVIILSTWASWGLGWHLKVGFAIFKTIVTTFHFLMYISYCDCYISMGSCRVQGLQRERNLRMKWTNCKSIKSWINGMLGGLFAYVVCWLWMFYPNVHYEISRVGYGNRKNVHKQNQNLRSRRLPSI